MKGKLRVEDPFGYLRTVKRICNSCSTIFEYPWNRGFPGMVFFVPEDTGSYKKGEYYLCCECVLSKLGVPANRRMG